MPYRYPPAYKATPILLTGSLSYILAVMARLSPPVVAQDIMEDMHLSPGNLSLLFAITLLSYALVQPVAGFLTDRFGPRRCLILATLFLGLSTISFGLAQSFWTALIARAIAGISAGFSLLPCLKLAENWVRPRYFGLVCSAIIGFSAIGNGLVGRPLALAAEQFGWRNSFLGLGAIGIGLTALLLVIIRDLPVERAHLDPGPKNFRLFKSLAEVIKMPEFWRLGFLYAGTDMIFSVFMGLWVGPYMIGVYGLSGLTIGNMLSISAIGFFIGPPLLALWGQTWSYARVILTISILNVILALIIITSPPVGITFLFIFCLLAPVGSWLSGIILATAHNLVPHLSSSIMGFVNFFAIFLGAAMQKIVGSLLDTNQDPSHISRETFGAAFLPILAYLILTVFLARRGIKNEKKISFS